MHKTQLDKLLGRNAPMRRKILFEYVQTPSGVADRVLAENLGIDHSNLRKHLRVLREFELVSECQTCNTRNQGRVGTPTEIYMMGHRLNYNIATIATIADVIRLEDDLLQENLQYDLMESLFYYILVDELVKAVDDALPLAWVWGIVRSPDFFDFVPDTANPVEEYVENGHLIKICRVHMTPDEKDSLKFFLRDDWIALEFVLHFLAADDEKRYEIIAEMEDDTHTPYIHWEDVFSRIRYYNEVTQNILFDCHVPSYLPD